MALRNDKAPIIIKRITAPEEGGHHGGAWKVAYADFVTAMMAFFLLMWLLNATTEQQRAGLADYFNPTIIRVGSGAGGAGSEDFEGAGKGQSESSGGIEDPLAALNQHVQDELAGIGAESMQMKNLLRHVVTRVTDEGLVIELSDLAQSPLFLSETAEPTRPLRELAAILGRVLARSRNHIAIAGHVRSYPAVLANSPIWDLSNHRADAVRELLESTDLPGSRIQRVTGFADRRSQPANPAAESNNRVEVILLK